jgi:hypothetical protein
MGMLEGMINDIIGVDLFDTIYETLNVNLFSTDETLNMFDGAYTIIRKIYEDGVQPVAVMLLFIYFMLAVLDKLSSENFTWEQLWRQMAMLLGAKFLIDHGFDLMEILFQIGVNFAYSVDQSGAAEAIDTGMSATEMLETFKTNLGLDKGILKILASVIMFMYLLIPWIFSFILGMAVKIVCYTRVVEIYLRAAFAPIALSDFFHSGFQGTGWRFLKSFFAVCLQGAFILTIAIIYSILVNSVFDKYGSSMTFWESIGVFLSVGCASVMLMFKSLSLAKEMLGTN